MHFGHSGLHSEFQVSLCYRVNPTQKQTTDRQANKHYRKLYLLVEICFKGPLQWRFRYKTSWETQPHHTSILVNDALGIHMDRSPNIPGSHCGPAPRVRAWEAGWLSYFSANT